MNIDRLWVIAAVAGMIVVAVAGWFVGISPIVAQVSTTDTQLASTTTANTTSQAKLALLKTQFASIGKLRKSLNSLRVSIPEEADASEFVQEVNALCATYGVALTSVTINDATVYAAPAAPTPPASTTDGTSTPTPTPTATAPAAPTTATATPTGGLVLIPVVIVVTGTLDAVRDFDGAVQNGPRLYLATSAQIAVDLATASGSGSVTGTLTGDIFTIAGTSPPTKSAAPTSIPTPTPTPTLIPTPTATPTPTPTTKP
jgi:hypothetical protein